MQLSRSWYDRQKQSSEICTNAQAENGGDVPVDGSLDESFQQPQCRSDQHSRQDEESHQLPQRERHKSEN